jgi:hypothetical protein
MVNVLIVDLTPLSVRGKYLGVTQLTAAIGLVGGIVMGAAFSTLSTWRLIFWINIPICAVSGAGILFFIRPSAAINNSSESRVDGFKALDVSGIIILTGSLLGLLYGVMAGGTLYPWNSARIIASLVIGALGLVTFTVYELNVAKHPMIQMRLFNDRTVASGFFAAWTHGVMDIALAYYLILYVGFPTSADEPVCPYANYQNHNSFLSVGCIPYCGQVWKSPRGLRRFRSGQL